MKVVYKSISYTYDYAYFSTKCLIYIIIARNAQFIRKEGKYTYTPQKLAYTPYIEKTQKENIHMKTRSEKISETKRNLSAEEKERTHQKQLETRKRNKSEKLATSPKIQDMLLETYDIIQLLLLANNPKSQSKIDNIIKNRNEVEPSRNYHYNYLYQSLSFNYGTAELIEKYGKPGYSLWKKFFKRISKGGITKTRETFVSIWAIDQVSLETFNQELYQKLNENNKKEPSIKDKIEIIMDMIEMSREYTETELVVAEGGTIKVVGKQGTKELIDPIQKHKIRKTRKAKNAEIKNLDEQEVKELIKQLTTTTKEI
jgi:hypothetical protein